MAADRREGLAVPRLMKAEVAVSGIGVYVAAAQHDVRGRTRPRAREREARGAAARGGEEDGAHF